MKRKEYPSDPWFYASFEGARIAALLKTCDLPFSEKLDFFTLKLWLTKIRLTGECNPFIVKVAVAG